MRSIMPAPAPPVGIAVTRTLREFGERIRAERKRLKLSSVTTAEAAGMSRVTLFRIEKGEPSVAVGAYLSALDALGLAIDLGSARKKSAAAVRLPAKIRVSAWPQLKRLAWQLSGDATLSHEEALEFYERNWRHVDEKALMAKERALIDALLAKFGRERLLV